MSSSHNQYFHYVCIWWILRLRRNIPASLVTAIIFHQLFEGLSLGIRIAALPQQNCEAQHPENGNANGIGEPLLLAQNGNGWDGGLGGKGDSDKGDGKGIGGLGGVCLKPILAVLFAIGTPVGIAIGLLVFVGDGDSGAYPISLSLPSFPRISLANLTALARS